MTKENELRLGNIVAMGEPTGFEMIVTGIYDGEVCLEFMGNPEADRWDLKPEEISGIPLTEEWLKKAGFEKGSSSWKSKDAEGVYFKHKEIEFYGGFDFNLTDKCGQFYLSVNHEKGADEHTITVNIYYLHQLQNAFFALTGSELKIK